MPKTRTATIEQSDLFGPPMAVAVIEIPVSPAPQERKPKRKVHRTQREGHTRVLKDGPTIDERVLLDIKGNGKLGRTRQEIADRTDIAINSVCGAVDRLMKRRLVFEPVIDFEGTTPIHFVRERRKVVVDALYQDTFDWRQLGQPLYG